MTMERHCGEEAYNLIKEIFPICRSITGEGVRETLSILSEYIGGDLNIYEIPSGTKVFDWEIPKEWNIKEAYIENENGERIIDFIDCNLHVLGYSTPIDCMVSLDELKKHVYTQADQPDAIPYVTSYYEERFGFCMSKNQLDSLKEGMYHMVINSSLQAGSLTYADYLIKGQSEKEIIFSSYICHPSMGNNECSGPAVIAELIKYLKIQKNLRYSYRFILCPETIGTIAYLATDNHLAAMKENVVAGYNLTCVGDNNNYSMVSTKYGNTLTDQVLEHVLKHRADTYKKYSFLERGSDERQYNSPGVDIPVCCFCRTKYWEYPEYHTSLDDLDYISPEGLQGSIDVMIDCINAFENNYVCNTNVLCEPQLGRRGLYPLISQKGSAKGARTILDYLQYADGTNSLIEIAELIKRPVWELYDIVTILSDNNLISLKETKNDIQ